MATYTQGTGYQYIEVTGVVPAGSGNFLDVYTVPAGKFAKLVYLECNTSNELLLRIFRTNKDGSYTENVVNSTLGGGTMDFHDPISGIQDSGGTIVVSARDRHLNEGDQVYLRQNAGSAANAIVFICEFTPSV